MTNPDVVNKVDAVFESYWNSGDFVPYNRQQFDERTQRPENSGPQIYLSPIEFRPEPFQERLLEQIELARQQGHHKNLLVSATGTGKTVMAAIDYVRLRAKLPRSRLLFVAHRKEILDQSMATFRHAMRDHQFGEMWVDGQRPKHFENVFASIQSLNVASLDNLDPNHFDIVIIDEFHHAAAASYRKILNHLEPVELLGLPATPERSDDLSIFDYFDGRIAAELRLWDAIDRHRLVPFAYFGIHDGQDLSHLPFRRGTGYDIDALTNVYTGNDSWVRKVIKEIINKVSDIKEIRALGFCVSIVHAQFMAKRFNEVGIKALARWSDTDDTERQSALKKLANKDVNVIFSVDLFNEGVDIPSVDTLLLLRPTQSPTLFLQQLGRGLRNYSGKSICTVLDFVGRQHQDFRFDIKLRALLGGTRKQLEQQVKGNFPYLPAGCHMELDRVASEIVLQSIRQSVPNRWQAKVEELRLLATSTNDVSIEAFLNETGLDLEDIYTSNKSWTELCREAGIGTLEAGPDENSLLRAVGRLLHVDDPDRLAAYKNIVDSASPPSPDNLSIKGRKYLRMLIASLVDQVVDKNAHLDECIILLWKNPQVLKELSALFDFLTTKISHLATSFEAISYVPISIHARYTRIEILAAFGRGNKAKTPTWREGVLWAENAKADLMVFTLDKDRKSVV
jgi:superfamily II DNA or RNA helicase